MEKCKIEKWVSDTEVIINNTLYKFRNKFWADLFKEKLTDIDKRRFLINYYGQYVEYKWNSKRKEFIKVEYSVSPEDYGETGVNSVRCFIDDDDDYDILGDNPMTLFQL